MAIFRKISAKIYKGNASGSITIVGKLKNRTDKLNFRVKHEIDCTIFPLNNSPAEKLQNSLNSICTRYPGTGIQTAPSVTPTPNGILKIAEIFFAVNDDKYTQDFWKEVTQAVDTCMTNIKTCLSNKGTTYTTKETLIK